MNDKVFRCQKCKYMLAYLPNARCPECGEPFDESALGRASIYVRKRRWLQRFAVTFACLALLVPGVFYLEWCVAWNQLGHRPRPSIDDPKATGGFATAMHEVTSALLDQHCLVWLIGAICSIVLPFVALRWYARIPILYAFPFALSSACFLLLVLDPFNVVYWWAD